jgi:hypothetical protein
MVQAMPLTGGAGWLPRGRLSGVSPEINVLSTQMNRGNQLKTKTLLRQKIANMNPLFVYLQIVLARRVEK